MSENKMSNGSGNKLEHVSFSNSTEIIKEKSPKSPKGSEVEISATRLKKKSKSSRENASRKLSQDDDYSSLDSFDSAETGTTLNTDTSFSSRSRSQLASSQTSRMSMGAIRRAASINRMLSVHSRTSLRRKSVLFNQPLIHRRSFLARRQKGQPDYEHHFHHAHHHDHFNRQRRASVTSIMSLRPAAFNPRQLRARRSFHMFQLEPFYMQFNYESPIAHIQQTKLSKRAMRRRAKERDEEPEKKLHDLDIVSRKPSAASLTKQKAWTEQRGQWLLDLENETDKKINAEFTSSFKDFYKKEESCCFPFTTQPIFSSTKFKNFNYYLHHLDIDSSDSD